MSRMLVLGLAVVLMAPRAARGEDRYALIVSGASGGQKYAEKHEQWRTTLDTTLRQRLQFDSSRITVLTEDGGAGALASRENLTRAIERLRSAVRPGDVVFIVLIGHGTFDGTQAKFNLVGPDLDAEQWSDALRGLPGLLVVVNSTGASFPFLERLSGPDRVVVTATDSAAQRFETVFPEYFIQALDDPAADIDKNGRVSVWEAFAFASTRVRQFYEQNGRLATERALLDDNGDGLGKEAGAPGPDGTLASRTYLDAAAAPATGADPALLELLERRTALEGQVEELKVRRALLPPEAYQKEFEALMLELARVSQEIRRRSNRELR
jgi:hypothetical protein